MRPELDIHDILHGPERKTIRNGTGRTDTIEMSRSLWVAFDDLLGIGYSENELVDLSTPGVPVACPVHLGRLVGEAVMTIERRRRDNERELAGFHSFCARQPRNSDGIRRIERKAARLKARRAE